jgi:F0F1-type ATP synthase membrane subunit b/b'
MGTITNPNDTGGIVLLIATFIAKRLGSPDVHKILKRLWLGALVLGLIAVVIIFGLIFRACNRPAKLDEVKIQKIQKAIAKADRAEMEQTLVESRLAEQQIIEDTEEAEAVKEQTVKDARKEAEAMTNKELAEALEGFVR